MDTGWNEQDIYPIIIPTRVIASQMSVYVSAAFPQSKFL